MYKSTFEAYKNNLLRKAAEVRRKKEEEYFSATDVLKSFRKTADFRNTTTPVAIMNLGSKSLQSISDMVDYEFSHGDMLEDELPTLAQWDEKFVDAINYLLKLYASIREERGE